MQAGNQYGATIYALSSGSVPSGVAVIRISGPKTRFGLETIVGALPPPRVASLRAIRDRNNLVLDRGLVLFFPGPASFTGEDCAELHVHGGRAVIAAVSETLEAIEGFRYAEAGEFTRRAFENGKLDLTAVEGLGDLVLAQTEMQRRLALAQAEGGLQALYEKWMEQLTLCRGLIEAELDFSDEGDVPENVSEGVRGEVLAVRDAIAQHLGQAHAGEIVRDGCHVAIAGAPNAGKSSLLNALARRDASIVSDEPGTTRDVVTVTLDLAGYAVILHDTAGLRETSGLVEREGIRRAEAVMREADLVLYLQDLSDTWSGPQVQQSDKTLVIGTKADLMCCSPIWERNLDISVRSGDGMDELMALIRRKIEEVASQISDAMPTRQRHQAQLRRARDCLDAALADRSLPGELLAEELRSAGGALGRLTGEAGSEELLGVIFERFCIGK